jgi:hypothetical protein
MNLILPSVVGQFPRSEFVFCITVLRKVTQAFDGGRPILLVIRNPRRQLDQRTRSESINVLRP